MEAHEIPTRVIERVQKMLALANDSAASESERDNAMRGVHAILRKYNLDMVTVDSHTPESRAARRAMADTTHITPVFYGRPWARSVCGSVAELFFCRYLSSSIRGKKTAKHYFIGRLANATTASLLAEFLVNGIMKEGRAAQRAVNGGNDYFRSFGWGAAARIEQRVQDELRKARQAQDSESRALVVILSEEEENNNLYVQRTFKRVHKGRRAPGFGSAAGFVAGTAHGSGVNLNRQVD